MFIQKVLSCSAGSYLSTICLLMIITLKQQTFLQVILCVIFNLWFLTALTFQICLSVNDLPDLVITIFCPQIRLTKRFLWSSFLRIWPLFCNVIHIDVKKCVQQSIHFPCHSLFAIRGELPITAPSTLQYIQVSLLSCLWRRCGEFLFHYHPYKKT